MFFNPLTKQCPLFSRIGPSRDLWYFDLSTNTWSEKAVNSTIKPPGLSKHTLTIAGDGYLYVFGGSLAHGVFSNLMYRINISNLNEWELVESKGGKIEELHVTGHSMVYYEEINAFILFGGTYIFKEKNQTLQFAFLGLLKLD